jgi:hypothetical protein
MAPLIDEIGLWIASGGAVAAAYRLLRAWVETRNGRRIKISVDGIELEATQLNEEQFLRLFDRIRALRHTARPLKSDPGTDPALQARRSDIHTAFAAAVQADGIDAQVSTFDEQAAEEAALREVLDERFPFIWPEPADEE